MHATGSVPVKLLVSLVCLAVLAGCRGRSGGSGGGGGGAVTTANVALSVKDGWVALTANCSTRQIHWKFEPLSLTGSEGRSTPLDVSRTYTQARRESETHPSTGDAGWRCYFDDGTAGAGLRAGTWRITMNPAAAGPKCEEQLNAGSISIHFTDGQPGCVKGSGYPGD